MVFSQLVASARAAGIEFSENTSIHGIKYITEKGRRWGERSLWVVTEVLCLTAAIFMVMHFLDQFYKNPTITKVETYFHETWQIPFPSVTLCNVNQIFKTKALRLADRLLVPHGIAVSKSEIFQMLPLLGQVLSTDSASNLTGLAQLDQILKYNNLTTTHALSELGQTCEELLERCTWEGKDVPCSSIFRRKVTYLGFCCVFNSNPSDDAESKESASDLHTEYYGYAMGLTVLLNPMTDDYYWGSLLSSGVVCTVHDKLEAASHRSAETMAPSGREVLMRVVPSVMTSAKELRDLPVDRRRCLFSEENFLKTSLLYNTENCRLECHVKKTLRKCKCRPLHYGASLGPACSLSNIPCLKKHFYEELGMPTTSGQHPVAQRNVDTRGAGTNEECGCLAECETIDYAVVATDGDFRASRFVYHEFYSAVNVTGRTLLRVFYGSHVAALLQTDLISNPTQLMSSLGGIFSLFLGCSFMSVVEMVYFFTVRLWLLMRSAASGPPAAPALPAGGEIVTSPGPQLPTISSQLAADKRLPMRQVVRERMHRNSDSWGPANSVQPTRPMFFR